MASEQDSSEPTWDENPRTAADRQDFFSRVYVPVNRDWQQNGLEFVNAVQVQEMFAEATEVAALLAEEAEKLTDRVANLTFQRDQVQRQVARQRRLILSENFAAFKSHHQNNEPKDAFILAAATPEQKTFLVTLEEQEETLTRQIALVTPRLDKLRNRLKLLDTNMNYARQYLDYDKFMGRISSNGRL
jgi:hypothetical protein